MQGSVLLRRDNTVADTCMIWMDQRSCGEAEELNARLTPEETMRYAANYCLPSFWAAKLLWLRRHQPEVFDSIRKVLFPKDYLRWKMTGEIASEVSDASCTWLLDLPSRQWSDRLFRTAGLSRELVPERLLESQDVAGYLLPDVAERWGLRPGIPVAAGAGDQEAGGVGMGVTRPGTICSTIGTSGVVFGCSAAPFIDPESHGMYSQCHAVPGQYSFLGCTLGAGGSFKWMRDTFFAQQKEALAARGESIYDYMTGLAAEQQPGCGGLVFLPYLGGEGTPYVDPNARGVFFGLSYQSDLGALCRAVMEGVTFSLRDTVEIIRAAGVEISQIRVAGGGAKSALWRQMQADIFGQSVCHDQRGRSACRRERPFWPVWRRDCSPPPIRRVRPWCSWSPPPSPSPPIPQFITSIIRPTGGCTSPCGRISPVRQSWPPALTPLCRAYHTANSRTPRAAKMKGAVPLSTLDSKTVTSGDEAGISRELLLKMWENMNLARNFEEHVQWLFSKGLVHGTTHLGIGEEATAAGTIAALKPQDYVFGHTPWSQSGHLQRHQRQ